MTPIEIATKAYEEEHRLWRFDDTHARRPMFYRNAPAPDFITSEGITPAGEVSIRHYGPFENYDNAVSLFKSMRSDASWRAAFRAVANMDPTLPMYEETKLYGETCFSCVENCRAYILAAANEGESK